MDWDLPNELRGKVILNKTAILEEQSPLNPWTKDQGKELILASKTKSVETIELRNTSCKQSVLTELIDLLASECPLSQYALKAVTSAPTSAAMKPPTTLGQMGATAVGSLTPICERCLPEVGLSEQMPQRAAGLRTEPP